jgi:hypothetical protein
LQALKPLNIGVATGEMCCNRVMFKQFIQANALQYCQIDSCRVGGINEILAILLIARKFNGAPMLDYKIILFKIIYCPQSRFVLMPEELDFAKWCSTCKYLTTSRSLEVRTGDTLSTLRRSMSTLRILVNSTIKPATRLPW